MDARRWVWTTLLLILFATPATAASLATHRTSNFVVHAPTQELAKEVAEHAELWREELALQWLGKVLPNWYEPCQVRVKVGQIGAGGSTTFSFEGGEVFGWNMNVQGSRERILDSVIPHEVSHTIFACHFRRPLPRWADEGAATLVEHHSERHRQVEIFQQVRNNRQQIPLSQLLDIDEYPKDMQKVLALYAEGYSLVDFLVQQHGDQGRAVYLDFVGDALATSWEAAFQKHYGFQNLRDLDQTWNQWVLAGSPPIQPKDGSLLAQTGATTSTTAKSPASQNAPPANPPESIAIRGQSGGTGGLPRAARPVRASAPTTEESQEQQLAEVDPPPAPNSLNVLPPTSRRTVVEGHSPSPSRERIPLSLSPAQSVGD